MKVLINKKNTYVSGIALMVLLACLIFGKSVMAAPKESGSLTIKKFSVGDYENLKEYNGQSSDVQDVPEGAEALENIQFSIERLEVAETAAEVTVKTLKDTGFTKQSGRTDGNGELCFGSLAAGYYLVTETLGEEYTSPDEEGFVVKIPARAKDASGEEYDEYNVTVYPKNIKVKVEKKLASEQQVVGVDDVVDWSIQYPIGSDTRITNNANGGLQVSYAKNFYITDEMDFRLDYVENSAKLSYYDIKGNEFDDFKLNEGTDYFVEYDSEAHVLKVTFTDESGVIKLADSNIASIRLNLQTIVNYQAKGTETPIWNNARIHFENGTGSPYEREVFPPEADVEDARVPKVYPGNIHIYKVDSNNEVLKLQGAAFALARTKEQALAGDFIKQTGAAGLDVVEVTTDAQGFADISAIGSGEFYLVETKSPAGYQENKKPVKVTVSNDPMYRVTKLTVENTKSIIGKESTGNKVTGSIKTGDVVNILGAVLLFIASGGIIFIVIGKAKQRKQL
ncbi:SpaH/EbpB family LPXTG-anchored major pilin [Faecalicatena contorta]|uniref:Cna protein B-type domain-containing protein n=1 Tax=Faecalicatena contorta TaxID=39482 RepID=A0A315ZXZ6_9FIRM|nr:SpaH/EbpB family LPXTG-anchored major pilin [Faecalicatena contorta]PWJ50541.1 Cna protein B-type domain-containing protein [Faecalicatena contorta]SUQ13949.1 Cna protein B-type domain-containing protein [Faecalicatena contorta]